MISTHPVAVPTLHLGLKEKAHLSLRQTEIVEGTHALSRAGHKVETSRDREAASHFQAPNLAPLEHTCCTYQW